MNLAMIFFAFFVHAAFWFISYKIVRRFTTTLLEGLLNTTTVYFGVIIFSSITLSLFRVFNTTGMLVLLVVYGITTMIYLFKYKISPLKLENVGAVDLSIFLSALFLTIIILVRSWGILDITHDSIVYILPRLHLFKQLNSFLFDSYTNIQNIWCNQMNFEILSTTWNFLTNSVYFSAIPNQIFYFWGIIGSYLFFQKLYIQKKFALFGAIIIGLLPLNFLIAHTVKSDSALFACMVVSLYYYCSFWQSKKTQDILFFLLASFLAIGIKITALPFVGLLCLVGVIIERKAIIDAYNVKKRHFVFLIIFILIIGLHRYLVNWIYYGSPLIRIAGEELYLNLQTAFSSIKNAITFQFFGLNTTRSMSFLVITMQDVLAASGGYAFIPFLILGLSGVFNLFKKNILTSTIISVTIIQSIFIIVTRPWYPWSTRYFMILFLIIVWGGTYVIQEIYKKNKKISLSFLTIIILLFGIQTIQTLFYDHSLWLENRFSNMSVITRYDTIEAFFNIDKESKILFIANPDAPIYEYIKPENKIFFENPNITIGNLEKRMNEEKIEYIVITNFNREILNQVLTSKYFDTIRLRNHLPDQNNTNLFKFNKL